MNVNLLYLTNLNLTKQNKPKPSLPFNFFFTLIPKTDSFHLQFSQTLLESNQSDTNFYHQLSWGFCPRQLFIDNWYHTCVRR